MSAHRPPAGWTERYEAVASVVASARLSTATKAFCNCAVALSAEANAHTCPVCLGLPGALPALNARAVELAVQAALALGSSVALVSGFSREHRAPDPAVPGGYVLTQRQRPLAKGGSVQIGESPTGAPIAIGVRCLYLSEEVGVRSHDRFDGASAFDYNLAGAAILQIEGAAELRSPREARAYVAALARVLRVTTASDARLEDGSLDVRVSVGLRRLGALAAGEPCEVRNLRTLNDVEAAVDAECARQATVLEAGNVVAPQTLLWDRVRGELQVSRAPARVPTAVLVDADLPPLLLTREWIDAQRGALPELPNARRDRLRYTYDLDPEVLDLFADDPELAEYFESVARVHGDGPAAATWVRDELVPLLGREGWSSREYARRVRPADLAALLNARRAGAITDAAAAQVFATMVRTGEDPARAARRSGYVLDA